MTPQLRQMVRPTDFWDIFSLSQRARETKRLLEEVRQTEAGSRSGPPVSEPDNSRPRPIAQQYKTSDTRATVPNRSRQNEGTRQPWH